LIKRSLPSNSPGSTSPSVNTTPIIPTIRLFCLLWSIAAARNCITRISYIFFSLFKHSRTASSSSPSSTLASSNYPRNDVNQIAFQTTPGKRCNYTRASSFTLFSSREVKSAALHRSHIVNHIKTILIARKKIEAGYSHNNHRKTFYILFGRRIITSQSFKILSYDTEQLFCSVAVRIRNRKNNGSRIFLLILISSARDSRSVQNGYLKKE